MRGVQASVDQHGGIMSMEGRDSGKSGSDQQKVNRGPMLAQEPR